MRRYVFMVGAMAILLLTTASISYAASNLNLSKSNINRVAHPPVVKKTVAEAILKDVDNLLPGADEATVLTTVQKQLRTVKSSSGHDLIIRVLRAPAPQKWSILILENAADEAAALAVIDQGTPRPRSTIGAPAGRSGYDVRSNK
jgi:hypothetical protein